MKEIGPEHDMSYRKEVLQQLFGYIQSADSFYVLGGASVGKTRLMDHIFREKVQAYYLGSQSQTTWLIRVDLNRHYAKEDWNFYELLISSMMLGCSQYENSGEIFKQLVDLDGQVMQSRDFLRALRFFELAVHMLCKNHDINVCFMLDEFDEMYRTMPSEFFSQLRAVRDANKNQVCYGLFLRDLPERLRDKSQNESFYELLSPRMIGLGPYSKVDAIQVMHQLEERRNFKLSPKVREACVIASGGHPGLLSALLSLQIDLANKNERMGDQNWLANQEVIKDEFDKLWESISEEEQTGLLAATRGNIDQIPQQAFKLITAKGLLQKRDTEYKIFSPIFELYLQEKL
jgi:hypothetical protein